MSRLYTAVSLEGPDGVDVDLMLYPYRRIRQIDRGLKVRKSSRPRAGGHGTINRTRYRDEQPLVIAGIVLGNDEDRVWLERDAVHRAFAGAIDTPRTLKWIEGEARFQQAQIRLDDLPDSVKVGPRMIEYQATCSIPGSRVYSQTLVEEETTLGMTGGGGHDFPTVWPVTFAPSSSGLLAVQNDGIIPTPLTFVFTGPLTNPSVTLDGQTLAFVCSLAAGEELWIDTDDRSILLGNDPAAARRNYLDFARSTWFELPPGPGYTMQFAADAFSDGHSCAVKFRHAY